MLNAFTRIINSILNLKNEGFAIEDRKSWPKGFDPIPALQKLLKTDQVNPLIKLTANMLDLEMKFLHHLVASSIYMEKGSLHQVPFIETFIMYFIITKTTINLPLMMIHQIADAARYSKVDLPYGIALVMVFGYFRIDLTMTLLRLLKRLMFFTSGSVLRWDMHWTMTFEIMSRWMILFLKDWVPTSLKPFHFLNFWVQCHFTLLLVHPSLLKTYLLVYWGYG